MKYLATFLLAATLTTASAYADPTDRTSSGSAASVEPDGFLRPKSTPGPSVAPGVKAKGPKQPLTATLGKDNSGKGSTTTFASSDPKIYLVWKAETGTKGEKVHISWYSEGAKSKKLTDATQTVPGDGSISGSSYIEKPAGGFPAGKYRVDVSDDGKPANSIRFTVEK